MGVRVGLTLGKYAPLHRGHQLVIETALAEMDQVVVMIYHSPEVTRVPLAVRAGWLRRLYPTLEVLEAWDGPNQVGYTPELKRLHETYLRQRLGDRRVTHFYSSEPYGEHISAALGAVDRRVDPARRQQPISGTAVRADPFAHREFLEPVVYRDLITSVVFVGAPSTGKTTLAAALAQEYATVWMPEYGREYWDAHQVERRLSPDQLVEIAEGHLEREEALLAEANRYLFGDTNAITTLTFGRYYHGRVEPRLAELAERAARRYDLVFVCDTDIPYDDTWDRSGEVQREMFQHQVLADLAERRVPYSLLRGDLATRVETVRRVLARFEKYQNLLELPEGGQR